VDIAVIETGLGGRLDATNVLTPLLTITTDIDRDHVEILGDSLEAIAAEKAGIIKPRVPHLVGLLPPEAGRVIRSVCRRRQSPMTRLYRKDFAARADNGFDFKAAEMPLDGLKPALPGAHQIRNAALALKALAVLRRSGVKVSRSAARKGLTRVEWPGRFQVLRRESGPTLVLDVCHNLGGVRAFVDAFAAQFNGRRGHLIVGFVKRKPHQAMFDALAEVAADYSVVPLATRRSTDLDELQERLNWQGVPWRRFGSLRAAYNKLLKSCDQDDIIGVVGSHFLVGEFLKMNGWQ
jgi:dihydrofolate synthase/folylpolyglutamate synthase